MTPALSASALAAMETPAFVYDPSIMARQAAIARAAIARADDRAHLFLALKAFSIRDGVARLLEHLDGLHASSLFEARMARELCGEEHRIHLTSPGLRADEVEEVAALCDHVSFNTLSQWRRLRGALQGRRASAGLRVNPQMSLVRDERYDPSRRHSKLGASLGELTDLIHRAPAELAGLRGLLVHTNCDAEDLRPLRQMLDALEDQLGGWLGELDWINLGGGYLFERARHVEELREAVDRVVTRHDLEVFFEPGASLVRSACALAARVIDRFTREGREIAVLDTTVNHVPEVFEYQFQLDVRGARAVGEHTYLLAGATCLAGDLFGEYAFDAPLEVGDAVIFEQLGAYSMVKASMFNGVNLPTIYRMDGEAPALVKRFGYDEFLSRNGV